ncbi:MAG: decaprenyl-phosphate phosphoribosyltransferase [Clostridiales bacterium]|nr:decaprenyl-phosphate phosphoribosyltransferase [Clostridiales bacterium]
MKPYFKLLRVKHYSKNVLLLLPLVFGRELSDATLLLRIFLGFIAFCLVSSAVYIFNDIRDVEKDRLHPVKQNRPIASGAVSIPTAYVIAALLLVAALAVNALASHGSVLPWVLLLLYALLNAGYSMGLKDVPLLDITVLMSGFLLRLLYGSALVDIKISEWLYLTVVSMSFFMGLGKRRNELIAQQSGELQGETRSVLSKYTASFLDKSMYMCLLLGVVFYSLWCVDASTAGMISGNYLLWTVPLVILICMKYSMTIEGKSDGDPVEVLFSDRWLMLMVGLLGCAILAIIYL